MTKFALFSPVSGDLLARFDSDIHGDSIPESAVEISESIFYQTINDTDGVWKVDSEGRIAKQPLPEPTPAQLIRIALFERDRLLADAAVRIAPLQDAADLGLASPEELEALKAWRTYRVHLSRIEQQDGFPEVVEWPEAP